MDFPRYNRKADQRFFFFSFLKKNWLLAIPTIRPFYILYCCPIILFSFLYGREGLKEMWHETRLQNWKWLSITPSPFSPPIWWPPPPLLCPSIICPAGTSHFAVPHGWAHHDHHHKRRWSIDTEINHVHKYAFDVWLHRRAKTKANKMEIKDGDWAEPLFIASRFLSGNDEVRIASLAQ